MAKIKKSSSRGCIKMDSEYMVEKVVQALIATRQHEDRILALEKEVEMLKTLLMLLPQGEGKTWITKTSSSAPCLHYRVLVSYQGIKIICMDCGATI